MSKRTKIILLILLILFLMPQMETYFYTENTVWRFGNLEYLFFGDMCFDFMPLPKEGYAYSSMFLDLAIGLEYCEEFQKTWKKYSFTIGLFPYEKDGSFGFHVLWISLSDRDFYVYFLTNELFDIDFYKEN